MARDTSAILTLKGSRATVTGDLPGELTVFDVNRDAIGSLRVRIDGQEAVIDAVEITSERRGFGYGGEAVRLVEGWAREQGIERFRASVDQANGLGVYFLLRLGYHPYPAQLGDTLVMVRAS